MKQSTLDLFQTGLNHASDPQKQMIHPIVQGFMRTRGLCSDGEMNEYLCPDYDRDTHDPFLFEAMERCVDRVFCAVDRKEKIAIYGDYDVDGLCASTILYETLNAFGANVRVTINHREDDGYGIHRHAIDILLREGISLIITTDQGISNKRELEYASARGIDCIITDHHTVPTNPEDLPNIFGVLHPRVPGCSYPFKDLSGGGVAFKLAQALMRTRPSLDEKRNGREKWLLDLVCISTVADCVPLVGENRVLLHFGLIVLNKTRRPGIQALRERGSLAHKQATVQTILHSITPLLNAASRMDHAQHAFDLLTTGSKSDAQVIIQRLQEYNRRRQRITTQIAREAREICTLANNHTKKILVASSAMWPVGVLGLVANSLSRIFEKPIVLISERAIKSIGVARSTKSVHITKAFGNIHELFDRFGGHHRAGGFALKEYISVQELDHRINAVPPENYSIDEDNAPSCPPIVTITMGDITHELARQLSACGPWGQGNEKPIFRIAQCTVRAISYIGKKTQHLRLLLEQEGAQRKVIGIKGASSMNDIEVGDSLDIECEIDASMWQGQPDIFISLIRYTKCYDKNVSNVH